MSTVDVPENVIISMFDKQNFLNSDVKYFMDPRSVESNANLVVRLGAKQPGKQFFCDFSAGRRQTYAYF